MTIDGFERPYRHPRICSPGKYGFQPASARRGYRCEYIVQNGARLGLSDVQALSVGAAIREVRRRQSGARANAIQRLAEPAEDPNRAETGVRDGEIVGFVHRQPVRAAQASRKLHEQPDLRGGAVRHQRHAPDAIAARDRDVEDVLRAVEHDAVGTWHGVDDQLEPAVGAQPIDAAGRVVQTGLSLVGEIKIAVAGENQIVDALEALGPASLEHGRDAAANRIEQHDAVSVIRDEDPAVLGDLQPVRFAVILGDERELADRRDSEHAAIRDVDDVEIAVAIE